MANRGTGTNECVETACQDDSKRKGRTDVDIGALLVAAGVEVLRDAVVVVRRDLVSARQPADRTEISHRHTAAAPLLIVSSLGASQSKTAHENISRSSVHTGVTQAKTPHDEHDLMKVMAFCARPSKPHSVRRVSVSSHLSAATGIPSIEL